MDAQFWQNAWAKTDKPGWQQDTANELLRSHWTPDESKVFVPLCGRSPDLEWLHRQGHSVVGVELSESAVVRFLEDRNIPYTRSETCNFAVFAADRYLLYVGDFFALTAHELSGVSKVYDRAAMVAMPAALRREYVCHLQTLLPVGVELFVILLEYDQALMKGPPFSVVESELREKFDRQYEISLLATLNANFEHRGVTHALEKAYRLTCKKP